MITKKFDRELFDKNDEFGRNVIKNHFKAFQVKDNPDVYGPDLMCYRDGLFRGYIEVEVRHNWLTGDFPYDTLNIPYRKEKFFIADPRTVYAAIRFDGKALYMVQAHHILLAPVVENPNKYVTRDEYFYKVPIDVCILIEIGGVS